MKAPECPEASITFGTSSFMAVKNRIARTARDESWIAVESRQVCAIHRALSTRGNFQLKRVRDRRMVLTSAEGVV